MDLIFMNDYLLMHRIYFVKKKQKKDTLLYLQNYAFKTR